MGIVSAWRAGREAQLLESGERQLTARLAQSAGDLSPAVLSAAGSQVGPLSPWAPAGVLEQVTLSQLFGTEYVPIDRGRAMSVGAVAKGRHLLCGQLASFPLVHMKGDQKAATQSPLVQQPEIGRPLHTSLLWWADSLLFFGRVWLLAVERYAEDGRPRRFRWVPEWSAEVNGSGELVGAFGDPVNAHDVYRIDGPHDGLLTFGAGLIREALAIDVAAGNASANPVPSIELHQTAGDPLSPEDIRTLTDSWVRARQRSGGGVGYTNASVEAKVLSQPAEQLLIDGRNWVALNLARAMGLPAWAVDAPVQGTSLNYNNAPSRSRELVDYALRPYLQAIEARLSMDDILPAGQWARFDTSGLLQGDFLTRMQGYKAAIEAGIYTAEECKAMESGYVMETTP